MGSWCIDIYHAKQVRTVRQFECDDFVRASNETSIQISRTTNWSCDNGSEKIDQMFVGTDTGKTIEYKRGGGKSMVQNGCTIAE